MFAVKRPIELTVALLILFAEYLVLVPSYITALVGAIRSDTHGLLVAIFIGALAGFIILRPLALYLLWRGTSWVRTLVVWVLPIALALSLIRGMADQAARVAGPADIPHDFMRSLLVNAFSHVALIVGFLALLVLYLPRVAAWFRYVKETHETRGPANI
jgi:hypothetical protein